MTEVMKTALPGPGPGRDPLELLTPEELGELLKVRLSWIYDQVEANRLPVIRLGRRLRFRRGDVQAFLDSGLAAS